MVVDDKLEVAEFVSLACRGNLLLRVFGLSKPILYVFVVVLFIFVAADFALLAGEALACPFEDGLLLLKLLPLHAQAGQF
jgi:hypothetical protein